MPTRFAKVSFFGAVAACLCWAAAQAAFGQPVSETGRREVVVNTAHYSLRLDAHSGAIVSFRRGGREFIHGSNRGRPLFALRFRDAKGRPLDLTAADATTATLSETKTAGALVVTAAYRELRARPVNVTVSVRCPDDDPLCYWSITVQHDLDQYLEWIEFPAITVPNDLPGARGESRLFWPAMEGVVVDDIERRDKSWVKYHPIEFPNRGWEGFYPGPCQMQFMAYYGKGGGLYVAAHDPGGYPKGIEFRGHEGGIALEYRVYPGAITRGTFKLPYEMVLGVFGGDWHDAADIYRAWVKRSGLPLPPKLGDNPRLPAWIHDSPVVVTYPVRGTRDLGDMTPNEYFPYTKALPSLERLAKGFDSHILALLMHWEGSAPWAPPYVWPPFGGEAEFRAFGDKLHAAGNLLGVYCSGIAWTQKSNLADYNREQQFTDENLQQVMVLGPNGEMPWSPICSGENAQRWSYDMCPANAFVGNVVAGETAKVVGAGVDYLQYFDQDLGGTSYFCYAKNHGHPPAPGPWMKDAMIAVEKTALQAIEDAGHPAVLGCEAAAAEPYIPYLLFNDARFNINLMVGTPVPAYAYVYHEYVNNFMGNQNGTMQVIDSERCPHSFLQRLTYGFIAGDMLTVTLKGGGQIHWDWGTAWTVPGPDQAKSIELIRNLNAWRRGAGKPFLHLGRMEKPLPLEGVRDVPIVLRQGGEIHWPSLMTSRWTSPDGRTAQVVANYMPEAQACAITGLKAGASVKVLDNPAGGAGRSISEKAGRVGLKIAPLSAILVEIP